MNKVFKRNKFLPIIAVLATVLCFCISTAPVAYAAVAYGNTFSNVAAVQTRLSSLGYYRSGIDGKWGSGTLSAVKRFQSDNGLKADGEVGSSTARKLGLSFPINGGITYGKTDFNVAAVQARLKTYGYYTSAVDGTWGNGTLKAVLKYQSDNGMTVDGKVGSTTARKLNITLSSSSKTGGISKGKTTANVKAVQNALKRSGYYTGTADGVWGKRTLAAILSFQSDNGLTLDGVVGPTTERKLGITLGSGSSGGSTGSSNITGSNISQSDLDLLARCVYAEARGEPYNGQVAIAAVVLNRVRSSSFPNTIYGVIYQRNAFTAVNDGQINLTPNTTAYNAARDALGGWDPTGGCLYYYNPATATSSWIWSLTVHIKIGKHNFAL